MSAESPPGWSKSAIQALVGEGGLVSDGDWIESKDQDPDGDVRLIQLADIGDGTFQDRSRRFLTDEASHRLRCTFLAEGDVLVARMPDPLGRACIFPGDEKTSVTAVDVLIVRPCRDGVLPAWIMHAINAPTTRRTIALQASGTTRQRISGGNLKRLDLPVPPTEEQRRIVAKIEALMARSGRAKQALDAIPALLDRYRHSVLAAAYRGDLTADWRAANEATPISETLKNTPTPQQPRGGRQATATAIPGVGGMAVNDPETPLPTGWSWVPLLRLARQETGHTPSRGEHRYWDGDVPWIGIRDAGDHHGGIIQDTKQHVTQEGLANSSARLLPAGTVCLSRTASVGYVIMMGRDMATSQDFATWTCTDALDPSFLMYALLSEGDEIRRFGKGSTHTTIYFPEIRALHIALAPVDEQREIVRRVQRAFTTIKAVEDQVRQATQTLPSLDQRVLAKAFQGELVPQDPNDEPASELLARIKAERAAKPPQRGRRRKRKPRKESDDMPRLPDSTSANHLADILHSNSGAMKPEALWQASGLPIDDFYKQLKREVESGLISEDRDKHLLLVSQ